MFYFFVQLGKKKAMPRPQIVPSPIRIYVLAPKKGPPPGGLEPPTFRLTAERASLLRHGGLTDVWESK